ncbi:MAG: hypothetical protein ACXWAY_10625 [Acidimicrobiia bacterium]
MVAPRSSEPIDVALDELYGVDPAEFVATRKRLASELRSSGDKVAAKTVQDARRPTTAAWALNQLSRRDPDLVGALLDRSRELADAQAEGTTGDREVMRNATRAQREALAATTDAALAVLGARATEAYRAQVRATLQAASADDGVGAQLRAGRLVKEVSGSTGFPEAHGLTLVPDLPERAERTERVQRLDRPRPVADADQDADQAADAERRRLERERAARELVERRLQEAVAAADAAQDDAVAAESAAAEARERVERLEHDVVEARRERRAADDAAEHARREATRLARAATKLRTRNP